MVFTRVEFQAYCHRLGFSSETVELIESIRSSPPVRTPQSGRGNVPVWYPSRKMGRVIKAESHKVEFAFLQEHEYSDTFYEFYDQPWRIKLVYRDKNGHMQRPWHTPDSFSLGEDGAGFEEYKPEKELQRLARDMPNRYRMDENGQWICPPGEEWAAPFGLYYRVRSSSQINWVAQSNWLYMEDYYRRLDELSVTDQASDAIVGLVRDEPGITLAAMRRKVTSTGVTADDIHIMIVMNGIYVDLNTFRLADPDHAPLYASKGLARAYALRDAPSPRLVRDAPHGVTAEQGAVVIWDGVPWVIANVGVTEITLLLKDTPGDPQPLSRTAFDWLVDQGRIVGVRRDTGTRISTEGRELLVRASETDLAEAVRRRNIINGETGADTDRVETPARTKREWRTKWKDAQAKHNSGFIGLLPQYKNCGRGRQVPLDVINLIHEVLNDYYDTTTNRLKRGAYGEFLLRRDEKNLEGGNQNTFYDEVKRHLPAYEQALKRGGPRGAYPFKEFHHEEFQTISRHGDHAWQLAYLDHLEIDLQLLSASTGKGLGKAWLSLLIGGKTRSILAYAISFDRPSYRSCMLVVRDCVRRHGRLPQIIVVDGGSEFRSTYFEVLLAKHEVTKRKRPAHEPRFGAVLERLFGTMQTEFIYHLLGNTQLAHKKRQTTKATDPRTHARWTLAALVEHIERWAFHEYDTIAHPGLLGLTPREAYALSMEQDGERRYTRIPYDDDFIRDTYASTPKGTAKVQVGRGVQINYIYYWCDVMRDVEVEGTNVTVRYDPFDISVAYVYVAGQWRMCRSDYSIELASCSERELKLITEEIRKRQRILHGRETVEITQKQLAEFRRSNQQTERILEQQFRDLELRSVLALPVLKIIGDHDGLHTAETRATANIGIEEEKSSQRSMTEAEDSPGATDQPLLILGRYL